MAQVTLVEMQIKEGQTLLDRLAHEGIAVTAAGWVKESDGGDWYLYLATPLVGEDGAPRPAYGRVNAVIRKLEEEGFRMDPIGYKVLGPRAPNDKDMGADRKAHPGGSVTAIRGRRWRNT